MKIEEAGSKPSKSQKRTSSQALPSEPLDLTGDVSSTKRAKTEKGTKLAPAKKPAAKSLPVDPIEKLKEQVVRFMKSPDLSDPGLLSIKFWELMQEAGTDIEKRLALIRTAAKEGTPEVWKAYVSGLTQISASKLTISCRFSKSITVPGRLQQWIAQIWNSDKSSPLLPLCIKIIKFMNLSTTDLKATALHKTIEFLRRKKQQSSIAELADQVLIHAEQVEQRNIANGIVPADDSTDSTEKPSKSNTSTNAGVKRNRDDADNGGKADGAVKKPTMALAKPASPAITAKTMPSTTTAKPALSGTSTTSTANTTTTTLAKPKPTTGAASSFFFKSMARTTQAKPTTTYVTKPFLV